MNVLVVCATDYPDMDAVRERLRAGTAKEQHTTFIRKSDRKLKAILDDMGARYEVYHHDWWESFLKGQPNAGDAYNELASNHCDKIIVYHTEKSSVTEYFVKRVKRCGADVAAKTEIIVGKSKRAKAQRKGRVMT